MKQMPIAKAPEQMTEAINQAVESQERIILNRDGKEIAAIIPMAEFRLLERLLERLEDQHDIEAAEKILSDPDQKWTPLEEVIQELGLENEIPG
ncbi:MAG: type II toxin-antitoxin system Phd/YefM family antitoxin [Magnetococcales bacterium]|nr:type II toxin-antitoxin system Phd/YefM family antitoxin [Magnetococcales bacterium]